MYSVCDMENPLQVGTDEKKTKINQLINRETNENKKKQVEKIEEFYFVFQK